MTSVTDVCNLALSFVGKPEISSLDERSAAAGWCRRAYEVARRDALTKSDWIFARAYAPLIATVDPEHPEYGRTFARPADAVLIRAVGTGDSPYRRGGSWRAVAYDVIGSSVLVAGATGPQQFVWYTRDVLDPDRWCTGFAEAVAYKLASLIAPQATGRPADAVQLAQMYAMKWREAVQEDAAQERATWTNSEPEVVGGLGAMTATEAAKLVDYPYDETMIWGKTGTPVSAGGGAPPPPPHIDTLDDGISDFVALYEAEKEA